VTTDSCSLAVVILAAGRGSRLSADGADLPKWFLRLEGASIAEWQLEGLRHASALWSRLVIVTGYRDDVFDRSSLSAFVGRELELVHNPRYASHNNWLSLQLALAHLAGERWGGSVCVLNSDLLLAPQALAQFLETASSVRRSILAVDLEAPRSEEGMKVALDSERRRVLDIAKDRLAGSPAGEFIGLSKIESGDLPHLRQILTSFLDDPARASEWYEAAFREAIRTGVEFALAPVETGRWIEIDDGGDLEQARELARLLKEEE
jgi:choline kinase